MGTTLAHGIYLPSEGERNCYAGLKVNWETLDQKVADISALQSAIAGALHREIVASLPTTDIDTATIYMILNGTSATENVYDEYMYISNAWELIGTSATDLTNYYTNAEVDGKLLLKANASDLTSHTGDTTIHVTASDKAKWDTVALIKQLRLVNTQVGSATTIAFSDIDDTNGIKVGDKCMDLDAKMFEITAVDATNQTVTVGSALIDIALDANVMHLTGNETAGGFKTFSEYITSNGSRTSDEYSTNARTNLWLMSNKDTEKVSGVLFDTYRQNTAQGTGIHILGIGIKENGVRYEGCRFGWYWDNNLNGYTFDFKPTTQGVNQAVKHNLGTSTDKWDTINNINPGSLSFPDLNNGIDISGYITVPNAGSTYTPSVNGWISIVLKSTSGALDCFATQGDFANSHYGATALPNETEPCVMLSMPVIGGITVNIYTKGSNAYVYSAKFFPCLGNV